MIQIQIAINLNCDKSIDDPTAQSCRASSHQVLESTSTVSRIVSKDLQCTSYRAANVQLLKPGAQLEGPGFAHMLRGNKCIVRKLGLP